ncbi:thrombopoietin receptor [Aplochiton taeniatus]
MDVPFTWKSFLLSLWLLGISWECVTWCGDGTVHCITRKDILLLAGDKDPKCFTRTSKDFTCFIEVPDNQTYDFYYKIDDEKKCNTTTWRTEEGTFLHVCSFDPYDVYLYIPIHIRVLDGSTNATVYQREANVEDLILLDPPMNVSLQHVGQAAQLQVVWQAATGWEGRVRVMIRYYSPSLGTRTEENCIHVLICCVVKTVPPSKLKGELEVGRLCVQWEAPLQALSAHLMYQVRYMSVGKGAWLTVSLNGPVTRACLDVPTGRLYCVQVRARPHGPIYSGHWSEWSPSLTGDIPTDIGALVITITMLVVAMVLVFMFSRYFSMLKLYLWPPVPSLDKVLHGFLTEISRQTWDPPRIVKQCPEDTPASLVEIMYEQDVAPAEEKPPAEAALLPCPDRDSSGEEQEVRSPGVGLEVLRGSSDIPSCSTTDILNRSYLHLAEPGDRVDGHRDKGQTGKLYANLEGMT